LAELKDFQKNVQQVADAIESIMKVNVIIVDNHLERIAATGIYKERIGTIMPKGCVSEYVLKTKEHLILKNPRKQLLCQNCTRKNSCFSEAMIICPIKFNQKVYGVIGVETTNKESVPDILSNSDHYIRFLSKMADLLVAKLVEAEYLQKLKQKTKELEISVDLLQDGILLVNNLGIITLANSKASYILGMPTQAIIGKNIKDLLKGISLDETLKTGKGYSENIETYRLGKKNITLVANVNPIIIKGKVSGIVYSFNDYKKLELQGFRLTEKQISSSFEDIIGCEESFLDVKKKALKVAQSDSTVLILGESGTGKELFARAIHFSSNRKDKPFIAVNCAAIPESLLESELFGYEEGASTGARKGGKPGKFELANKGTIFLDEVGDMPLFLQAKILRVIEEMKVVRLGGTEPINLDLRIIAATNKNLEKMVVDGEFRLDLYFRLNVIPLEIPPLRCRKKDIMILAKYFLDRYNQVLRKQIRDFHPLVITTLESYSWPGNVRELENVIEYAVNIESNSIICIKSIPWRIRQTFTNNNMFGEGELNLAKMEAQLINKALQRYGTSVEGKKLAAKALGISLSSLYRKLSEI